MRVAKQSTARDTMVFMTDEADHVSGKTGLTLTITASKAGGAFGSISPTVTERGNGWYSLALTTSHTDTLGDLALHITSSGADPTDALVQVVAYDPADSVRMGMTALPNVASGNSGAVITSGTGTAQLSTSSGQVILQSGTGTGQLDFTSGVVKANVTQFGGSAGTFSSGRPEVNLTHIAGSSVSTSTAQLGVNVVNWNASAVSKNSSNLPEMAVRYWRDESVQTSFALQSIATCGSVSALANNCITAAAVSAAAANKVADHVRRRTQANVEASTDGDTLSLKSQYGAIQQMQNSNTTDEAGKLTVKKTNGDSLGTLTLSTDAGAEPVDGVS